MSRSDLQLLCRSYRCIVADPRTIFYSSVCSSNLLALNPRVLHNFTDTFNIRGSRNVYNRKNQEGRTLIQLSRMPPLVNGVLETSLYVNSAARSAEFYRRVFSFEVIDFDGEMLDDETRLCVLRAGDRSVLLLFKRGTTPGTDATGSIHVAFGIARSDVEAWEQWLA